MEGRGERKREARPTHPAAGLRRCVFSDGLAADLINLDRPYPNQVFTLLIWGEDRDQVGKIPETERSA